MKRSVLCILVLTLVFAASATLASAQTPPDFKLGFKALADQIPGVVGTPRENEHWGANGDSIQLTTNGMMAWRKADNWTAFTDGGTTWINGPNGIQSRLNYQRFPWEADAGRFPNVGAPAPSPAPTSSPVRPSAYGVILFGSDYTRVDGDFAVVGVKSSFSRSEEMAWVFNVGHSVGALSMDVVLAKVSPTGGESVVSRSQVNVANPEFDEFWNKTSLPSLLEPGQYKLRYFVSNQLIAEGGFTIR